MINQNNSLYLQEILRVYKNYNQIIMTLNLTPDLYQNNKNKKIKANQAKKENIKISNNKIKQTTMMQYYLISKQKNNKIVK